MPSFCELDLCLFVSGKIGEEGEEGEEEGKQRQGGQK